MGRIVNCPSSKRKKNGHFPMDLIFTEACASLGKEILPKHRVTNVEDYVVCIFVLLVGMFCFTNES